MTLYKFFFKERIQTSSYEVTLTSFRIWKSTLIDNFIQVIEYDVCVCLQEMSPGEVTLEGLLDMSEEQVCELLQKFGASEEECARLNASLSCLRKAHQLGETLPQTILEKYIPHIYHLCISRSPQL